MNVLKKNRQPLKQLAAAVLIGICAASFGAFAAPGGGGGGGGGGSGGGGGGTTQPDYGDLFVLLRDGDGIPILTPESCEQPLAAPGVTLPAVGDIAECVPASATESCVIPVDPLTCGVVPGYETYTQEVVFGRTNEARAPASMLEAQLEEAVTTLAIADCVSLDSSGRLVTSTVTNDVVTSAAIDSPLENLAIYKQLMLKGHLGADSAPLTLPAPALDIAASAVGAASSKTGKVTVDMVAYINQFLGLTDPAVETALPKKCINVKGEVKGVIQMVEKCFLDYGANGGNYSYSRGATFGSLPRPASIPAGDPKAGWSEYLAVDETTATDPLDRYALRFKIAEGPTLDAVPELMGNKTLTASSIGGFAQAADDTRATIAYLHSWPLPEVFATPLTCTASGDTHYDVSISEESGLQVPVRMVAGTEGREFTLTIANAGPDAAMGKVVLTAVDTNGVSIPTFPRTFDFTLLAGTSTSWTELFTIDYATTVTWTATMTAPFDVNPGNNSVTKTTIVTGTGGGGGGGGGIR